MEKEKPQEYHGPVYTLHQAWLWGESMENFDLYWGHQPECPCKVKGEQFYNDDCAAHLMKPMQAHIDLGRSYAYNGSEAAGLM